MESVGQIRIKEGKNDPHKEKKIKKFYVLKCWMFSFEEKKIKKFYVLKCWMFSFESLA